MSWANSLRAAASGLRSLDALGEPVFDADRAVRRSYGSLPKLSAKELEQGETYPVGSVVTAYSTLSSLVQEHAEDALRGRILSIYGLCFRGGMPFGGLVAGALVGPLGVTPVIGTMLGLLVVLAVGMIARSGTVARL